MSWLLLVSPLATSALDLEDRPDEEGATEENQEDVMLGAFVFFVLRDDKKKEGQTPACLNNRIVLHIKFDLFVFVRIVIIFSLKGIEWIVLKGLKWNQPPKSRKANANTNLY